MIARFRFYGSLREAKAEWTRFHLPAMVDDERQLFTKAFAFIEDADPIELASLKGDVEDLGGKAYRCDTSISRMLIVGSRDMFPELSEIASPVAVTLREALSNLLCRENRTIRIGGHDIVLDRTQVMGIVNVTPDSFSDGGLCFGVDKAFDRALQMAEYGVDMIDVGGESTRPFSDPVSESEELKRVIPVIERLSDELRVPISVDTRRPNVASRALESGAVMVNDISGLRDPAMISAVANAGVPVVLMHMRGEPKTMQENIRYDDVVGDIMTILKRNISAAMEAGMDPENIIIDPGIGFGKTTDNNLEIIRRLYEFRCMDHPIMVGPSRKNFIGKILDLPVAERLEGTLAASVASIINGADMIRVHDVKEAVRAAKMADSFRRF
ncbi:MAG: dihydropteroate synthase [Methanomassiliicoccales archaeon]|nr:dihydropteroate synthase [Methanomassiliicoccales archaeon]NYT14335.1 dihydropteroate synthase [Methanomassiliicoccales archaeon]